MSLKLPPLSLKDKQLEQLDLETNELFKHPGRAGNHYFEETNSNYNNFFKKNFLTSRRQKTPRKIWQLQE
jgi:hypothetical protein